jgi:hypothetical protein
MAHLRLVASAEDIDPAADRFAFTVLAEATAQVVGDISKVAKVIRAAVEENEENAPSGLARRACARAFDSLPTWQRYRIAEAAARHAAARVQNGTGYVWPR